ncbi:MAG: UbiA family prenyltransferase [Deltaproteobacteria bacterium]|nr:UbiA family prenyltransferase [Deltaproteobacteria bacterium]
MIHPQAVGERILIYGRMIKFSHTLFALPFALAAVVLAQRENPLTVGNLFWLLMAMIGARSAAMGFNRIADVAIDSKNPRTSQREIPTGRLSRQSTVVFVALFSGLFVLAASRFGALCFYLSVPILILLFAYSYTKRFTILCHLCLGFAISMAPLGAWIALTNSLDWPIFVLSGALMTYIAGFDTLYACQDAVFDRKVGLYSIPARFGIAGALALARGLHLVSMLFFVWMYFAFQMGHVYLGAVCVIGALMITEHCLVKPDDLSHIHVAFFHMNSLISLVVFLGVFLDELLRGA